LHTDCFYCFSGAHPQDNTEKKGLDALSGQAVKAQLDFLASDWMEAGKPAKKELTWQQIILLPCTRCMAFSRQIFLMYNPDLLPVVPKGRLRKCESDGLFSGFAL